MPVGVVTAPRVVPPVPRPLLPQVAERHSFRDTSHRVVTLPGRFGRVLPLLLLPGGRVLLAAVLG